MAFDQPVYHNPAARETGSVSCSPTRAGGDSGDRFFRETAIEAVFESLRKEPIIWRAKQSVKDEMLKPQHRAAKAKEVLVQVLSDGGWSSQIKNVAYEKLRRIRMEQQRYQRLLPPDVHSEFLIPPLPVPLCLAGETSSAILWARWKWSSLLLRRLTDLSREQEQPFLRPRPSNECGGRDGSGTWAETDVVTRHIVDLDRLYKLITTELAARTQIQSKGSVHTATDPSDVSEVDASLLARGLWLGTLGVHLRVDSLENLKARYNDLSPEFFHLGIADVGNSASEADFADRRRIEGNDLLSKPYVPTLQEFARFGVPPNLRRDVWTACLGVQPLDMTGLSQDICDLEWITDDVLRLDVAEHCVNNVCYFPFDELIENLVVTLSRDETVAADCEGGPPQIPLLGGKKTSADVGPNLDEANIDNVATMSVPPCGVIPFKGFSSYACPFAFMAEKLEVAYPLFRAFYCRYLSRLHTISSEPATLLSLCALFESLLATTAPHVVFHLSEIGLEAAPLRFALPWIVCGFVGVLRANQVFWLWDRIVGFDSVQLLAVLAAAIFSFRSRVIVSAKTADDISLLFSDMSSLQAIPLLQGFFFNTELGTV